MKKKANRTRTEEEKVLDKMELGQTKDGPLPFDDVEAL